jgi:protein gp37
MAKTKIEWCDFTVNPVKGLCPMACSYCYARRMYKRFHWPEEISYDRIPLLDIDGIKKPSKIFVGSTMELFGPWVKEERLKEIFDFVKTYSQHTFIFLTKQPQNLARWTFPENCWVGVSATNDAMMVNAVKSLKRIKATVKFISFEPLLERIEAAWMSTFMADASVSWIILGQQTPPSPKTSPRIEWIQEIVQAADKAGIPVFLKDNLKPIMGDNLRQEFPRV